MTKQKKDGLVVYLALSIVLLVIFLGCGWWSTRRQPTIQPIINDKLEVASNNNLATIVTEKPVERFISFSDLFSGSARLDQQQTNLTRDPSAMVFTFKPNIQLTNLGDCSTATKQCQLIDYQLDSRQVCLDGKCLAVKGNQLIYQQRQLTLPNSDGAELINLDISSLKDRWFIGGVKKLAGERYQPLAWLFDGQKFVAINLLGSNGQPVKVKYLGYVAAGGQASNFLVLYSAYDGLAWQFNGPEMRDLSPFFGIRVNAGGFRPKIIYTGQGKNTTWYVFNQGDQPVRWLKFWQNGTDWIEGMLDLSDRLPIGSQSAHFLVDFATNNLQAKIINSREQASLWSVNDLGFILPGSGQVVSTNLIYNDQVKPQIVGAVMADALGGWSGFEQEWSLSTDNQHWQTVTIGERLNFSKPAEQLWWRWRVLPSADQWRSPCLKMITINYFRL